MAVTPEKHVFKGSTRLRRGWYDPAGQTVELEFADGALVVYTSVPPSTWQDLTDAPSAGRFVSRVLERYPFKRRR